MTLARASGRTICLVVGLLVSAALFSRSDAYEFKYMETEKLYNTVVREEIQKLYVAAMLELERKALSLGMKVRDVDVRKLKAHLRDRAFLYAQCSDRAILASVEDRNVTQKTYYVACVQQGMKIGEQTERQAWSEWARDPTGFETPSEMIAFSCRRVYFDVPAYDFLKEAQFGVDEVTDYFATKECIVEKLCPKWRDDIMKITGQSCRY